MHTIPLQPRPAAALAAVAIALACDAGPASADTGFIQQNGYAVTVDPGSKLTIATGYSGANATGFTIPGNPPYLLQVGPGGNAAQFASLIATFTADPGRVFTAVDWRLSVPVSTTEGSGYVQMNWAVAGNASSASGTTPTWTNGSWFYSGTPYLDSPPVALADGSFLLDIGASLRALGYPGGCSGALGQCATVGVPWVDVYVQTAAVPEPGTWVTLGAGLAVLLTLARRRRGSGETLAWKAVP